MHRNSNQPSASSHCRPFHTTPRLHTTAAPFRPRLHHTPEQNNSVHFKANLGFGSIQCITVLGFSPSQPTTSQSNPHLGFNPTQRTSAQAIPRLHTTSLHFKTKQSKARLQPLRQNSTRLHGRSAHSRSILGFISLHANSKRTTPHLGFASTHSNAKHHSAPYQSNTFQHPSPLGFISGHITTIRAIPRFSPAPFTPTHLTPRLQITTL